MSFKNMLGKLAKKAIEEAPNLLAKAAAEASKRQVELDKRKSSPSQQSSYSNNEPKFGGFTLDQWDKR